MAEEVSRDRGYRSDSNGATQSFGWHAQETKNTAIFEVKGVLDSWFALHGLAPP